MTVTDLIVPDEQEGTTAIVRNWLVQVGQYVAMNDPLVELETDKVTQEIPAPISGTLLEILLGTDAEARPGMLLGRIGVGEAEAPASAEHTGDPDGTPAAPAAMAHTDTAQAGPGGSLAVGLSPAVRRAIKRHGIDPAAIAGTGRNGRITVDDVEAAAALPEPVPPVVAKAPIPESRPPQVASTGRVTAIPHDRMRLAIAHNMANSVTVAPHVTAVFECDFSAIIAHRKQNKASFARDGANLTFTAYIVAACAAAMRAAPAVNSRWYDDRLDIYDDINIGVGTALGDKGLIVPVVQRVQDLSLLGLAARLTDLVARARDNALVGADVRGGTFTISNHGVSGSLLATPIIINQPQSAILGVGKLEKRMVVREIDGVDTIQIRPMCYVSLTIDHRALDGHQTNSWLAKFVETLETWPL